MEPLISATDLLDQNELADLLGVTTSTVRVMRADRQRHRGVDGIPEPIRKVGNAWVWDRAQVEAWLATREGRARRRTDNVYVVQRGNGPVKIGVAADVTTRLAVLQTASAEPLRLIATFSGGQRVEHDLHARFAHLRIRGEWFRPDAALLDHVAAMAG